MKTKWIALTLLMMVTLLVAACTATETLQPTDTASPVLSSATALPSETSSPVPTETVTPSPSPSPLPSSTPTPSRTPTPVVAFDQAEVISYAEEPGSNLLILKIPSVKTDYKLKIDNFDYYCYYDALYIDRLFCRGNNRPTFSRDIKVVYYDAVTNLELYSTTMVIVVKPTFLPVVYDSAHNCDLRGTNVTCEVECRINPENGNPCLAASCFDACGPYFSVHSCPTEMDMNFRSCNESQWAQQKALYGIP